MHNYYLIFSCEPAALIDSYVSYVSVSAADYQENINEPCSSLFGMISQMVGIVFIFRRAALPRPLQDRKEIGSFESQVLN